jgi:hypothetical protein
MEGSAGIPSDATGYWAAACAKLVPGEAGIAPAVVVHGGFRTRFCTPTTLAECLLAGQNQRTLVLPCWQPWVPDRPRRPYPSFPASGGGRVGPQGPGEFQPDIGPAIGYYCPMAIGGMRKSSPGKGGS